MTTALDSIFFEFFEFWILTNHNFLPSIVTNQFASFCIDISSRQCYFRVCQSGEIWNKKAFFPYILIFLLYKTNVVRTSVTHSAAPCVPLFCSYHILTSSVIYYWNRRTATWNLFVKYISKNREQFWFDCQISQRPIRSRLNPQEL